MLGFLGHQSYVYRLTLKTGPHPTSIFPLGGRRGEAIEAEVTGLNMEAEPFAIVLQSEDAFTPVAAHGRSLNLHIDDLSEFGEGGACRVGYPVDRQRPHYEAGRS